MKRSPLNQKSYFYAEKILISNFANSQTRFRAIILNIIRTKGGKNRSILVEDIDIDVMRNFQIKEYELQKDDSIFKPTPPQFDKEILKMKMERTLKDYLWK